MSTASQQFDGHTDTYVDDLQKGLSLSGEDADYFARKRIQWLHARLRERQASPKAILDFGCGIGLGLPLLANEFTGSHVTGFDTSQQSLQSASQRLKDHSAITVTNTPENQRFELIYTNGVIHHIPIIEREAAFASLFRYLKPGGYLGLWENNPWNPGTRMVMRRIPFDRDAIVISAREAASYLRKAGFDILVIDHLFIFPRLLRHLRGLETFLTALPLGAQYQILCKRPN